MCLWRALSGIVGTEEAVWWDAAAAATCDWTIDGGRIGLQGEWELPDAFEEAAKGTPVDEYRSWLNCVGEEEELVVSKKLSENVWIEFR